MLSAYSKGEESWQLAISNKDVGTQSLYRVLFTCSKPLPPQGYLSVAKDNPVI
jgi:hypothetical protein